MSIPFRCGMAVLVAAAAHAQTTLYALDTAGNLIALDKTTGAGTVVGNSGFPGINSAASDSQGRIFTINSGSSQLILLNSATRQDAAGLGNSSGLLGKYLQVHFTDAGASAEFAEFMAVPSAGGARRPNGLYVPRFRNLPGDAARQKFLRGYGYQGSSSVPFHLGAPGYGEAYKKAARAETPTVINLQGFGECLPNEANRVEIDPAVVDAWGIPAVRITIDYRDNDRAMLEDMGDAAAEMLEAAGGTRVRRRVSRRWAAHEVGTARMGTDPKTSVLTPFQQTHDVANLFVMDGSSFPSGGWSNPTLTMMALAVRSTDNLLDRLRRGE